MSLHSYGPDAHCLTSAPRFLWQEHARNRSGGAGAKSIAGVASDLAGGGGAPPAYNPGGTPGGGGAAAADADDGAVDAAAITRVAAEWCRTVL